MQIGPLPFRLVQALGQFPVLDRGTAEDLAHPAMQLMVFLLLGVGTQLVGLVAQPARESDAPWRGPAATA